ncbi:MAG TPA: hypothetical protein VIW23_04020 [Candidatus Acidoferrum sp.]
MARQAMRVEVATHFGEKDEQHAPLQREILRDVMLSAGECETWLTLESLARMTGYPPASISAQLRHLRKTQHGGYRLRKRCRPAAKLMAGVQDRGASGPVWEYRLERRRASVRGVTQQNRTENRAAQQQASA